METKYFTADFFGFLKNLSKNNNRDWFTENKPRYEASVQEPALRFIHDAGLKLKTLSPHLVADARPFGGSLSRIYRDIRFSADKSPYKTELGIHFWHGKARGPEHMNPGLYLHLGLDGNFAGGGVWHPDAPILKKVRDRIVEKPDEWKAVRKKVEIEGESLKRVPPGYDVGHPFVLDLRRKDFLASRSFRESQVTSPGFLDDFIETCAAMDPLNAFLARAVGVPW